MRPPGSARRPRAAPRPGRAEVLGSARTGRSRRPPAGAADGSTRSTSADRAAERDAWAVLAAAHGLGPVGFAEPPATAGVGARHPARRRLGRRRSAARRRIGRGGAGRHARPPDAVARGRGGDRPGDPGCRSDAGPHPGARPARRDRRGRGLPVAARRDRPAAAPAVRGRRPGRPRRRARDRRRGHATRVERGPRARVAGGRGADARPARASCPGWRIGIDGAAHAATLDAGGRDRRGHRRRPRPSLPAGARPAGRGHHRRRRCGRLRARAGPGADRRARSRAGTGSSAASPTRRWSSRRPPGAARSSPRPGRSSRAATASSLPGAIDDPRHAGLPRVPARVPGGGPDRRRRPAAHRGPGACDPACGAPAPRCSPGRRCSSWATRPARIGEELLAGRATVDELVAVTGWPVATVLATLTVLERNGLAVGVAGRFRPAGTLATAPPPTPPARLNDGPMLAGPGRPVLRSPRS